MLIRDVMTEHVLTVKPDASIQEIAQLMRDQDIGAVPVADNERLVGMVTDRDIVVRTLAVGLSPMERKASDVMTAPCLTVPEDSSLDDCTGNMEKHQVPRMLVVDEDVCLCGIDSQADVALNAGKKDAGELLRDVSKPGPSRETVTV